MFAVVLCPLSVTDGWMAEMANFAPKLRVLSYTGEKEHRRNLRRKIYEHMNKEASDVSIRFYTLFKLLNYLSIDNQI